MIKRIYVLFSVAILAFTSAFSLGAEFSVSSTGTGSGVGTVSDPLTAGQMQTAIAGGAHDTIYDLLDLDDISEINIQAVGGINYGSNTNVTIRSCIPGVKAGVRVSILSPTWTLVSGKTNTYSTSSFQFATAAQNGVYLPHFTGASYSAVATALEAAPGYFTGTAAGTGAILTYIHPLLTTNPISDGNIYELSYPYGGDGSANIFTLGAGCVLQDIHLKGIVSLAGPSTETTGPGSGQIGVIAFHNPNPPSVIRVQSDYGYKHNMAAFVGTAGGSVIFKDCTADQCSPYAVTGGTTNFVSYTDTTATGTSSTYTHCITHYANAVAGSGSGKTGGAFIAHSDNVGVHSMITMTDCDFGTNYIHALSGNVTQIRLINCKTFGFPDAANCFAYLKNCTYFGPISNDKIITDHCLFIPTGTYAPGTGYINNFTATNCVFDLRYADHASWQYIYAAAATNVTMTDSYIIANGSQSQSNSGLNLALFGFLPDPTNVHCDRNQWISDSSGGHGLMVNNAGSAWVDKIAGSWIFFAQWQENGQDLHGTTGGSISGLNLSNYGAHLTPTAIGAGASSYSTVFPTSK